MSFGIRFLVLAVFSFSALIPIVASDAFEKETFQFNLRAFGDDYFEGIYFDDAEDERVLVEFSPYERTEVYHLPEDAKEVAFYRLVMDERGREREETVAVANLESIESRAFIVFVARRDLRRNLPYTLYVADESPGQFEAGQLRFLNLAGPPLLARVGDETLSLEYGFGGDIQFDPDAIKEVRFQFAVRVAEKWKIVYSSGFRAHPKFGTLVILKPPMRVDSLQIQVERTHRRYFFDRVEPTEALTEE